VFDRSVLTGRIHRLKDQQHSPVVLGIEFVLQLGQGRDTHGQRFLRSGLVGFLGKFKCVARINILETKFLAFGDPERLGEVVCCFDNFFCFHKIFIGKRLPGFSVHQCLHPSCRFPRDKNSFADARKLIDEDCEPKPQKIQPQKNILLTRNEHF
jgi:hypothetical protein